MLISIRCINLNGTHNCLCSTGYSGNGTYCEDINECSNATLNTCHSNAVCSNTMGSHSCSCKSGYEGDGYSCTSKHHILSLLVFWNIIIPPPFLFLQSTTTAWIWQMSLSLFFGQSVSSFTGSHIKCYSIKKPIYPSNLKT